jgi:hypothetical protein
LGFSIPATTIDVSDARGAAGAMLGAAAALPLLPGHAGLPCPLRTLTGVPCPLCGMTTSVEETVRLHLFHAAAANPGGVLAVVVALVLLVRRPRHIVIPAALPPFVLCVLWLFELHRFAIL